MNFLLVLIIRLALLFLAFGLPAMLFLRIYNKRRRPATTKTMIVKGVRYVRSL